MKEAISKTGQWQDRLDMKWRALPVKLQRRYTMMLFLAYLCIAGGIVIQYSIEVGKQAPAIVIRHIDANAPEPESGSQKELIIKNKADEKR